MFKCKYTLGDKFAFESELLHLKILEFRTLSFVAIVVI